MAATPLPGTELLRTPAFTDSRNALLGAASSATDVSDPALNGPVYWVVRARRPRCSGVIRLAKSDAVIAWAVPLVPPSLHRASVLNRTCEETRNESSPQLPWRNASSKVIS